MSTEPFDWNAWLNMSKRNRPVEGEQGEMFADVAPGTHPKPAPDVNPWVTLVAHLKASKARLKWDEDRGQYALQRRHKNAVTGKFEWRTLQFYKTLTEVAAEYDVRLPA